MKKYFLGILIIFAFSLNSFSQAFDKNEKFLIKGDLLDKDTVSQIFYFNYYKKLTGHEIKRAFGGKNAKWSYCHLLSCRFIKALRWRSNYNLS